MMSRENGSLIFINGGWKNFLVEGMKQGPTREQNLGEEKKEV